MSETEKLLNRLLFKGFSSFEDYEKYGDSFVPLKLKEEQVEYNEGDLVMPRVTTRDLKAGVVYRIVYSDQVNKVARVHTTDGRPIPGSCTWGWLDKCVEKVELTCTTCETQIDCKCAFDMYNTDGDCLANK